MSVKRYDIDVYSSFEGANWTLIESEVGDFVYANEHEISIAELQRELAESERYRQILIQQNMELLKRVKVLRELCGYIEDGSNESVTISQDDATGTWHITIGHLLRSRKSFWDETFEGVLGKAVVYKE